MSQEKTWPMLVGKGGKTLIPPLQRSGGYSNGDGENENAKTSGEFDSIDPIGSPDESSSARSTTSPRSTSPRGGSASSPSKPKPDLRARALMSHKKMQEQFNPKKSVTAGGVQGSLSLMSSRVTLDEIGGRALAFALDLAESLHDGRRPTLSQIRLIADMLRLLSCPPQRDVERVAPAGGRGAEDNHHELRPTKKALGGAEEGASKGAAGGGGGGGEEDATKAKKKKKKESKKDKPEKKDKKGKKEKSEKTGKAEKKDKNKDKKDKKERKDKKDKKKRKSKERNGGDAASEESGSGNSGIDSGRGLEVLGGRLECTKETKGENDAATSLVTVDALKLRDLVHAHLKQALSSPPPTGDRSPRRDGQGNFPWDYEICSKTDKGVRDVNEDTYVVVEHYNDLFALKRAPPQIYVGLFDGHMGKEAAEFCRAQLHLAIAQEFDGVEEGQDEEALTAAFLRADKLFNEKAAFMGANDGSTAMAAFVRGDRLVIANCGDSKAMLCRRTSSGGTELLPLCTTQNPNREDEKERVKKAGGTVVWYGTWRVNAVLGVSRSIGDRQLKHIIIPQPEVQVTRLSPEDEFAVLATDGLWDYMKEEEVAAFIKTSLQTKSRAEVCDALVEHVVSGKNSKDNVTVIIVFFDYRSSSSSSSSGSSHRD